ncbi:sensor domain-containing protein [Mycobacterium adipatum]|nr:sensor domain-containing protein [Mycobacterium adipatum]
MTHNSDGEYTRPYTPPTPPPPSPWPAHAAGPVPNWTTPAAAPTAPAKRHGMRWAAAGIAAVAVIGGAGWAGLTMSQDAPASQSSTAASAERDDTSGADSPDAEREPVGGGDTNSEDTETPDTTAVGSPQGDEALVPTEELPNLLLSGTTLADLLVFDDLVQVANETVLYTAASTDRPECGGVINPAMPDAYRGAPFKAIRLHEYHDTWGDIYEIGVTEAVVEFPDEQSARAFVTTEAGRWQKCKYDPVRLLSNGTSSWSRTILTPELNAGVLTVSTMSIEHSGLGCQRGLSSRSNIVIDVQICEPGGTSQAPQLISAIADRIPNS